VAPTLVSVIGGLPKIGKSTLVFWMTKALASGQPFLGRKTTPARTLLLTEERAMSLNEKRKLFAIGDDDVHILMRHEAVGMPWKLTMRLACTHCRKHGLQLLVIDSWDKWATTRSDAENSAGDTLANLAPVMDAAATGLAVAIVHHQRDAPGRHGARLRGSNALAGGADVILELERSEIEDANPADRIVRGTSRLLGTPAELPFSWNPTAAVAAMNGHGPGWD